MQTDTDAREIVLPAAAIRVLGRAVEERAGRGAVFQAFRDAGRRTGELLGARMGGSGQAAGELTESEFWRRLGTSLAQRGLGTFRHESPHPGVGLLTGRGWAEDGDGGGPFTQELLAGLLSEAAGAPVRVLRVAGGTGVSFAFGAPDTVALLEQRLAAGQDLTSALASL